MSRSNTVAATLEMHLRALKLPSFLSCHVEAAELAEREGWSFAQYLHHLSEVELADRRTRKIERLRQRSNLPADKTLVTIDVQKLPVKVRRRLPSLCEGDFVTRADNVLAFGKPGTGKTHTLCAIGHELVYRGVAVLFTPAYRLVQRLLGARRDLRLDDEVRRLDRFDVVILDDIGYVKQDRTEMEVLFTFLAERYERRSVLISSNLVFSEWDRIFGGPMRTGAAIDQLVHHAVILEMTGKSYRSQEAKQANLERKSSGGEK